MNYKKIKRHTLPLLAAFIIGIGVLVIDGQTSVNSVKPNAAEIGFAQDMSVHHQQAIEMSFLVRETSNDPDILGFAFDIINTQAAQRGMMLGWLDLWEQPFTTTQQPMMWMMEDMSMTDHQQMMNDFTPSAYMQGMATSEEMNTLTKFNGLDAEQLFLELMIRHHKSGVMMAEGVIKRSDNETVVRLAQAMINGQEAEIDYMKGLLLRY